MTRAALLLVFSMLATGCLVLPTRETTTRRLPDTYGKAVLVTPREVTLATSRTDRTVRVTAMRIGECRRPVMGVTESTTSRHAKLGVDDPRAQAIGLVFAIVTIPVSALITGAIVAGSSDETHTDARPIGTQRFACQVEANQLVVTMTLPSGGVVRGTTNIAGTVDLEIPETEPYDGMLAITAALAQPASLAYSVKRPPYVAAREAVNECAGRHRVTGHVELRLMINSDGFATRMWLTGDELFGGCVKARVAGVRFPEAARDHTIKLPFDLAAPAAASL